MKHINDKVCRCFYCTLIDIVIGDPLLNAWERTFVDSVCRSGWLYEYTKKQKAIIVRIWRKMLRLRHIKK